MAKKRLRKRRVALGAVAVAATIFMLDNVRREFFFDPGPSNIVVSGDFREDSAPAKPVGDAQQLGNSALSPTTAANAEMKHIGFYETMLSPSDITDRSLYIVNEANPLSDPSSFGMVNLMNAKNEFYTLVDDKVMLNKEAADAFNRMMADYNAATGLYDFIVYGTTATYTGADSFCPQSFAESALGTTVDLAINGHASVLTYDGLDEEGWVVENCAKYGFIVRYPEGKESATSNKYCPWHLRYVGDVNSAIMAEKNLCLEEYIDFLRGYSFDKPFKYSINEVNYEIYSVHSKSDLTAAMLPIDGNYTISGNNIDSYIVTQIKG